jgi:hypothetical protein
MSDEHLNWWNGVMEWLVLAGCLLLAGTPNTVRRTETLTVMKYHQVSSFLEWLVLACCLVTAIAAVVDGHWAELTWVFIAGTWVGIARARRTMLEWHEQRDEIEDWWRL